MAQDSHSTFNFLPSSMDKECSKAAATLRSFCGNPLTGFTESRPLILLAVDSILTSTSSSPVSKSKASIPHEVLANCIALVIFSTARIGMHLSGSTGSGIIIARLSDGSWGPPAGIKVHGLSAGIGAGVAVYDCVCVVNTKEGLMQFTEKRVGLGSQVSVAAGPFGAGGGESRAAEGGLDPQKAIPAVYTYVKTRGLYAGVQIDGTVVSQREDANAAFYGEKVTVQQILRGEVRPQESEKLWPKATAGLMETLNSVETVLKA
ncbi:uncharacterized protein HMPREF1541_07806 [Cyphellophora europaea CBS 101466]|uniref:Ysc84 actin-binding domain-containing protein n=1 Tax=Cyphellophora europaea (strain CBS 101466) TaxID=1220924 RepID=W2RM56_CYPE1|nr:uncharacterized protein HMPREF1541_07806 [Cyphellophora europaea CBS 101466]ETN36819.1 hypothetical protein HMPREF1541_07806 [Cyphellophora europaea CBS 101466]